MDVAALQSIFTTLPVDIVAAVLFATAITVVTLRMGAGISIAFSLALIVANALFASLPSSFMLGAALSGATPTLAAGIYSALAVVMTFILYRATSSLGDDSARPLFAIVTGLATTIVVLCMWQATPLQTFWHFNPLIQGIFGEVYRLYWLVLAFIAYAFVKS